MASTLHQLEQAIAAAEQESQRAAEQIYAAYRDYLRAIASASRQRLVLAAYHVCTRNYPQSFLKLSLTQRQALQKSLRHLGQRLEAQTLALLTVGSDANPDDRNAASTVALPDAIINSSLLSELETKLRDQFGIEIGTLPKQLPPEATADPAPPTTDSSPDSDHPSAEQTSDVANLPLGATPQEFPASETSDSPSLAANPTPGEPVPDQRSSEGDRPCPADSPNTPDTTPDTTPDALPEGLPAEMSRVPHRIAIWLQSRDHLLTTTLQTFSHKANRLLHNHKILPRKLPGSLLEIATQADLGADRPADAPSLLDLTIATGDDEDEEGDRRPVRLVAIHLRPDDLHLADATVARCARHLRILVSKLESLAQRYDRIHRQLTSARAEAAWRSSWFDDDPPS